MERRVRPRLDVLVAGGGSAAFARDLRRLGATAAILGAGWAASGDLVPARHLHVASAFPQPGSRLQELFRAAKEAGLSTSFDPQWEPGEAGELDLQSILPFVDVFLSTEAGILALTGEAGLPEALDALVSYARILVVRLADRGFMARFDGKSLQVPPFPSPPGADSGHEGYGATFLFRFLQGAPVEECLAFANQMASSTLPISPRV